MQNTSLLNGGRKDLNSTLPLSDSGTKVMAGKVGGVTRRAVLDGQVLAAYQREPRGVKIGS